VTSAESGQAGDTDAKGPESSAAVAETPDRDETAPKKPRGSAAARRWGGDPA
jgi:hypothetical protein